MVTSIGSRSVSRCLWTLLPLLGACGLAVADDAGLNAERVAAIRRVQQIAISPDGTQVAYQLVVPRQPGKDDDGRAWDELHVIAAAGGPTRAFVTAEVKLGAIDFTPDGRFVTYLAERDDNDERALWAIPLDGGESRLWLEHDEKIESYRISPDGKRLAFLAHEPVSDEREKARDKGYKQEIYEEDWRPRRLWIAALETDLPVAADPSLDAEGEEAGEDEPEGEPVQLDLDGSVFDLEWLADGESLAVSLAPTPLIDDRYMAQRVHIVDAATGETRVKLDNPGKLGSFEPSPDGRRIAMISAADPNDTKEGRLLVAEIDGDASELRDLLPGLRGHVRDFAWRDARTLIFIADEGVETVLGEVDVEGGSRKDRARSGPDGSLPLLGGLSVSDNGEVVALTGESPTHPRELFLLEPGKSEARRLTDSNPWLAGVALGRQEVVRWPARDELELEGILIHPLGQAAGTPAPLLLMVHGGPEAHDRNGWVTGYSRPGQVASAQGFAVLYPNYRGSTGRGVEFAKSSQGDAAGKEFDDLIDAVDALVERGVADNERVGINGGSYGGYATAWCSTYHTDRFRAGVMFVGISNKVSKGFTTEIPVEDRMVHTRFDPWTRWQYSLERSPLYHAEHSRTALLIASGTADTRVHPSQSLQLYRALKLLDKTPVRFVRYPGEGHGNSKAAARDDYSRRLMRWMVHFVRERKTELPPWILEIPALADDEDGDD